MPAEDEEQDLRKIHRPWWGKKDALWGGETFTANEVDADGNPVNKPKLGISNGDKFRVEKKGVSRTLSLHHMNKGTLRDADNEMKPLELERVGDPKNYQRAYAMIATVVRGNPPQRVQVPLFLAEREGGSVVITDHLDGPGSDDGTANVER